MENNDLVRIVQQIQYLLAPAVMVSSVALFLLGIQNRFLGFSNRFRALTHEKRTLANKTPLLEFEKNRLESISYQVQGLAKRLTHIKNAILIAYAAIICFLLTSILLFFKVYAGVGTYSIIIFCFMSGLALFLIDCLILIVEVNLAFEIIQIEIKSS